MTYRKSFLSTTEYPLKELELISQELPVRSTLSVMDASNGHPESNITDHFSSLHFMKKEVHRLRDAVKQEREKYADISVQQVGDSVQPIPVTSPLYTFKSRRTLKGQSKIMCFDWSPDQRHIIAGGQNGSAYIWDGFTNQKELTIYTACQYVLACAYSPSTTLAVCGGLNRKCHIYSLNDGDSKNTISKPQKEIAVHDDYITNCRFFSSDQQLLTAGADRKIALWDLEREDPVQEFKGHSEIVMGLALNRSDPFSNFASCSGDQSVCLWDARSGKCVRRIYGPKADINQVKFFPNGDALAYVTNDGNAHLFDLKADQEIMVLSKQSILFGASSLDFSKSGRILFVGYDDNTLRAWDTLKGDQLTVWYDHEERVSHVQMSPDYMALGTSSWDGTMKIWA